MILNIIIIELITIIVFMFYSNNMVIIMILVRIIAIFFVDRVFMIMSMMSWPIMVVLMVMMGLILNGLRVMNSTKMVYVALISIITPVMMFLYLLVLLLSGLVMISVLRAYFGY